MERVLVGVGGDTEFKFLPLMIAGHLFDSKRDRSASISLNLELGVTHQPENLLVDHGPV